VAGTVVCTALALDRFGSAGVAAGGVVWQAPSARSEHISRQDAARQEFRPNAEFCDRTFLPCLPLQILLDPTGRSGAKQFCHAAATLASSETVEIGR
jgi:hypothetical protein